MPEPVIPTTPQPAAASTAPATSPTPATPTPSSAPAATSNLPPDLSSALATSLDQINTATGATTAPTIGGQPVAPEPVAGAVTAPVQPQVPGQPAPVQPAAPAAPANPVWFEPFAQALGVNAANWTPDRLVGQLQQTIQDASRFEQEARQLRQQLAQAQQQPAPVQPAATMPEKPKQWWEQKVEYNPDWDRQIVENAETGALSVVRGADPAIIQKRDAFLKHRVDVINRFAQDPAAAIQEMVAEQIKKVSEQTAMGSIQQVQAHQQAQTILKQNESWMMQRDLAGNQVLTPMGQSYRTYFAQIKAGNPDLPDSQTDVLCRKLLLADMSLTQQPQAPAQPAAPAINGFPQQPMPQQFQQPQGQWTPQPLTQPVQPQAPTNGFTQLATPQPGVYGPQPGGSPKSGLEQMFTAAGLV